MDIQIPDAEDVTVSLLDLLELLGIEEASADIIDDVTPFCFNMKDLYAREGI